MLENGTYLVDSGNDRMAGRKVKQILEANDLDFESHYYTHSMQYILVETSICKNRQDVRFLVGYRGSFTSVSSFWRPAFLFGGFPLGGCNINSLWRNQVKLQILVLGFFHKICL